MRRLCRGLALPTLVVLGALFALGPAASARTKHHAARSRLLPVLFVHGLEGTGAQFESQALRFISNGYPAGYIDEVDYDSTRAIVDQSQVDAQIDAKIADLKRRTGASKVDLVGHSLGTTVSYNYLTDPSEGAARRASVAHYVNIDGQSNDPGVPTLALWAGRRQGTATGAITTPHMNGAKNVTIPNQTHVQTCTSWQSFQQIYAFLRGARPKHDIVRQRGSIQLAGRALTFPQNQGLAGATVQVWPLGPTGHRSSAAPLAALRITDGSEGGGGWGPVTVQSGRRYEFAVVQSGQPTLHVYYEPFVHSDRTLRLLDSSALTTYAGNRPGSESAVNIRYKELWGDVPGQTDVLTINGTSVCTATLCPWTKQINAYFAFDDNRNRHTDLTSDPVIGNLPFIAAGDVFIPSSPGATGTTTFQLRSRGAGPVRTVTTPNWDSLGDGVIVNWNDYEPNEVAAPRAAAKPKHARRPHRPARRGGASAPSFTG
jgi:triacylglycerol esterase/lipase EstA (alpha/beta hydrolase family)